MRQKFFIFLALIFLIIVLVGLNAASYTQKEEMPDREIAPNRSTYNVGATGTRAFYDLLAETGRKPMRWQEPPSALLESNKNNPSTFVIIGQIRREFDDKEIEQLLRWVSQGGKLVIIDREPSPELIKTTANWSVSFEPSDIQPFLDSDPTDQKQMTEKTVAAKPIQPTVYTNKVNAVQSSRFASSVIFERFTDANSSAKPSENIAPTKFPTERKKENPPPKGKKDEDDGFFKMPTPIPPPPPPPKSAPQESIIESDSPTANDSANIETPAMSAPVVHLANDKKNLLLDVPFGLGEIVFLTDPYIVSNGGINLVDNAQIAVNIVASREGFIAFDEYHQGYGANNNSLLAYFAGTPLVAMLLQFAVLIGAVLFTQSRRFARPLPENEPNRLSKLEYVSAMAELQQRTKAFDLAIENIYTDFRRRVARLVGVDNFTTSRQDLAKLIAERAKLNADEVENLMFKCEDIIRGEPTNKREILQITSRLREIEEKLGLQRRKRK
ncbi:MAG: DUF4350 domain-containing protein [Pyrinomonadaceae bacterium]